MTDYMKLRLCAYYMELLVEEKEIIELSNFHRYESLMPSYSIIEHYDFTVEELKQLYYR